MGKYQLLLTRQVSTGAGRYTAANPEATGIRASGPVVSGKKAAVSKVHYPHVTVTERPQISQLFHVSIEQCLHYKN